MQRQDAAVETVQTALTLGHDQRLEGAVAVHRAGDRAAGRIVSPPQITGYTRSGIRRRALKMEPVDPARLERYRKPVMVVRSLDLARRRTADRTGGLKIGRIIIRHVSYL